MISNPGLQNPVKQGIFKVVIGGTFVTVGPFASLSSEEKINNSAPMN